VHWDEKQSAFVDGIRVVTATKARKQEGRLGSIEKPLKRRSASAGEDVWTMPVK